MRTCHARLVCFLFGALLAAVSSAVGGEVHQGYVKRDSWAHTILASRAALKSLKISAAERRDVEKRLWAQIERDFPIECDWAIQDAGNDFHRWFGSQGGDSPATEMIARALEELGPNSKDLQKEFGELRVLESVPDDRGWLELYIRACRRRRENRLEPLLKRWTTIVFTKHYTLGGSHYAYTEGQSDAQRERHFVPGASLCLLEMEGNYGKVRTLITDPNGVIRDPDVSYDGKRILFAWKKSDREDDYHLYEMDVERGDLRQLTFGLGFADYEPAYLPNGDIIFNSTRCVQTVDCWWTEVSNLYTCDKDGRYLRRLTFDQVHTNYPTVKDDGKIIYTRWEYNDRGQLFPQPLFQMNPDGTAQTECYGNNSWFPTTILHARGIPGSTKIVAILTGHHTLQQGKLAIVDTSKGRQEATGVQLIAPPRQTEAVRVDAYGQEGDQFQYPCPLSETEFLVAYDPYGTSNEMEARPYGIYFMTIDGRRELLAWDPNVSCNQPVPLAPRPTPPRRPSTVDYREKTGTFHLQDIYAGPGLHGIPRGAIKRLRVVALSYRAAGIGENLNHGPAGDALISTPIAIGNGSWDVKIVLGDASVHEDGSACFIVPARTPVYFQALDEKGRAVQTMRSWSTLQPGEVFSCVGCHENKDSAPLLRKPSLAMKAGAKPLEPFYGPARGFSFVAEIQPILDRHCIRCHNGGLEARVAEEDGRERASRPAFSLLSTQTVDAVAKRKWSESYLWLTQGGRRNEWVNWVSAQSAPPMLPPYHAGAATSHLIPLLERGHEGVKLSREELDKLACWIDLLVPFCGDYTEANAWSPEEGETYNHFLAKRRRMEQLEEKNIEEFVAETQNEAEPPAVTTGPAEVSSAEQDTPLEGVPAVH